VTSINQQDILGGLILAELLRSQQTVDVKYIVRKKETGIFYTCRLLEHNGLINSVSIIFNPESPLTHKTICYTITMLVTNFTTHKHVANTVCVVEIGTYIL